MAEELNKEMAETETPKRTRRPRSTTGKAAAAPTEKASSDDKTTEQPRSRGRQRTAASSETDATAPKSRSRRKKMETVDATPHEDQVDVASPMPYPNPVPQTPANDVAEAAVVKDRPARRPRRTRKADKPPVAASPSQDTAEKAPESPEPLQVDVASPMPYPAADEPQRADRAESPRPTESSSVNHAVVPVPPRLQAPAPKAESEAGSEPVASAAQSAGSVPNGRPRDNRRPPEAQPHRGPGGQTRRDIPRQREPQLTMAQLDAMTLLELYKLARQFNIDNFRQYKKGELIWEILRARTHKDGFVFVQGLLDIVGDYGFLRPTDFQRSREDVYVSASQIRRFDLRAGDQVSGQARPPKDGERYFALLRVEAVNALSPEKSAERPDFDGLTPIFPDSRFRLETSREDLACRLVDIIAPIGRGQRGLIVAPPKAGKTVLLKKLANAIAQNSPETHLMVLLIDERPEEVTDMERSVKGEVASSTFDEPPEDHIRVAEMVLERAKRLVEMGLDVVILLDSITRLARAYNLTIPASGRTLSGGMDPAALHKPKRFFGAARRVEHGGSLTILATALVDTGSRMDDVIYEEFKGTGNMELHLDRKLAERRTFPAVDIKRSGTRREDLLMTPEELDVVWQVRKAVHNLGNQEATELLLQNLKRTRSNAEFFKLFMASQGSQG